MSVFIAQGQHSSEANDERCIFSLAAAAVTIVQSGISLRYLVPNCEELLLEDWYKLAPSLRIPQTVLAYLLTHITTAEFNFAD